MLQALTSLIIDQLATPRPLSVQVLEAIMSQHQQTVETMPVFLTDTLLTLDDTAIDLLMSPAFTPTLAEREACVAVLGPDALTLDEQKALMADCLSHKPNMTVVLPNDTTVTFTIPEVNLMRYIKLLQLTRPEDATIYAQIDRLAAAKDKVAMHTLARESAWAGREPMLLAFLPVLVTQPVNNLHLLTNFVRTYRPASLAELDRQLESYIRSCESDLNRAGEMRFHDERLKEKYVFHGEGSPDHAHEEQTRSNYLHMMDQGRMLRELLQQVNTAHAI